MAVYQCFVDTDPNWHILVIAGDDQLGVVEEVLDNLLRGPPVVGVHESKRSVPMEQGHNRLDASRLQRLEDILVVIESFLIDIAATEREDTAP